ncbi:hypothetical protein [Paenibacillus sp. PL91]|uniref:hypothetical protein n=1 Tax=Paenibacillus sp. PL91 TaxID=2729538 RepID=UPI00145D75A0|nr:hypothetical protein [Paenibacillus sp. PL91]MBC9201423.1 hypothetical protein [Paenibacillus sp. PL91]
MYRKSLLFVLCWAILLSAAVIMKPAVVYACSCAMSPSPESQVKETLEHNTTVFAGKAMKVVQPPEKQMMSSADLVQVNFEVSTVWKGELEQRAIVYTAMSSASCGYENFIEGQQYLVSASEVSEKLETGICDLTKPLDMAREELKILWEGHAPLPLHSKQTLPSSQQDVEATKAPIDSKMLFMILLVAFFIMIAIVILLVRRRRLK